MAEKKSSNMPPSFEDCLEYAKAIAQLNRLIRTNTNNFLLSKTRLTLSHKFLIRNYITFGNYTASVLNNPKLNKERSLYPLSIGINVIHKSQLFPSIAFIQKFRGEIESFINQIYSTYEKLIELNKPGLPPAQPSQLKSFDKNSKIIQETGQNITTKLNDINNDLQTGNISNISTEVIELRNTLEHYKKLIDASGVMFNELNGTITELQTKLYNTERQLSIQKEVIEKEKRDAEILRNELEKYKGSEETVSLAEVKRLREQLLQLQNVKGVEKVALSRERALTEKLLQSVMENILSSNGQETQYTILDENKFMRIAQTKAGNFLDSVSDSTKLIKTYYTSYLQENKRLIDRYNIVAIFTDNIRKFFTERSNFLKRLKEERYMNIITIWREDKNAIASLLKDSCIRGFNEKKNLFESQDVEDLKVKFELIFLTGKALSLLEENGFNVPYIANDTSGHRPSKLKSISIKTMINTYIYTHFDTNPEKIVYEVRDKIASQETNFFHKLVKSNIVVMGIAYYNHNDSSEPGFDYTTELFLLSGFNSGVRYDLFIENSEDQLLACGHQVKGYDGQIKLRSISVRPERETITRISNIIVPCLFYGLRKVPFFGKDTQIDQILFSDEQNDRGEQYFGINRSSLNLLFGITNANFALSMINNKSAIIPYVIQSLASLEAIVELNSECALRVIARSAKKTHVEITSNYYIERIGQNYVDGQVADVYNYFGTASIGFFNYTLLQVYKDILSDIKNKDIHDRGVSYFKIEGKEADPFFANDLFIDYATEFFEQDTVSDKIELPPPRGVENIFTAQMKIKKHSHTSFKDPQQKFEDAKKTEQELRRGPPREAKSKALQKMGQVPHIIKKEN